MRKLIEFRVVHEDGSTWDLLDREPGPKEYVTLDTRIRGREWLACITYVESMYTHMSTQPAYVDMLSIDIWTAGSNGELLYSYGRHGEYFADPEDSEGEEEVA